MLDGMVRLLPTAEVGFLGMIRDEATLQASRTRTACQATCPAGRCFALDPMLATGGTLAEAIELLLGRGATDVTAICLLAAPEGVARLRATFDERPAGDGRDRRPRRAAEREGLHRPRARRRRRPAVRHGLTRPRPFPPPPPPPPARSCEMHGDTP